MRDKFDASCVEIQNEWIKIPVVVKRWNSFPWDEGGGGVIWSSRPHPKMTGGEIFNPPWHVPSSAWCLVKWKTSQIGTPMKFFSRTIIIRSTSDHQSFFLTRGHDIIKQTKLKQNDRTSSKETKDRSKREPIRTTKEAHHHCSRYWWYRCHS